MTGAAFEPVIGIEVHAELATRTKMFCRCPNDPFELPPNSAVCPTCLGLPGALPRINREAVRLGLRAALALGCEISTSCLFERKSYAYPDLLKGFQISQYEAPLGLGGAVVLADEAGLERRIPLRRIHLEEDTAKLTHGRSSNGRPETALDANRSGVPLLEIVTEPAIHSVEEADAYLRQLKSILLHQGISRCRMQRGELRLEANVSLRCRGSRETGNRVEIKNQSSFRFVRDALAFEIERQEALLSEGRPVAQTTRGWDPERKRTFEQRAKEEAHDYRYFPDPDLPPVAIDRAWIESERQLMPLPLDHFRRSLLDAGVPLGHVRALMENETFELLLQVHERAPELLEDAVKWIVREVFALLNETGTPLAESHLGAGELIDVLRLLRSGDIERQGARQVIEEIFHRGGSAMDIVERESLRPVRDPRIIAPVVDEVLRQHPDLVEQLREGKVKVRGALLGAVLRRFDRTIDPRAAGEMLDERLKR